MGSCLLADKNGKDQITGTKKNRPNSIMPMTIKLRLLSFCVVILLSPLYVKYFFYFTVVGWCFEGKTMIILGEAIAVRYFYPV